MGKEDFFLSSWEGMERLEGQPLDKQPHEEEKLHYKSNCI